MCVPGLDPVTLAIMAASSAASAGGSYLNARAERNDQQARQDARRREIEAEQARQRAMQAEASQLLGDTLTRDYADPAAAVDNAAAARTSAVNDTVASQDNEVGYAPNVEAGAAPRVVQNDAAGTLADVMDFSGSQALARGRLAGYGDAAGDRVSALDRTGTLLEEISNNARRSASVNSVEQTSAENNVKPSSRLLGDLLGVAGTLGQMYTMTGGAGGLFAGAKGAASGAAPMFNLRGVMPTGVADPRTFTFRSGVG